MVFYLSQIELSKSYIWFDQMQVLHVLSSISIAEVGFEGYIYKRFQFIRSFVQLMGQSIFFNDSRNQFFDAFYTFIFYLYNFWKFCFLIN